jgi:protein disulfide-isomerase
MKTIICALLILFTGFASAENWETDLKKAQEKATKEGKPLLLDFTGSDWCHWCIKLHEEVFSKKDFKDWAEKNVVLLKVDFPRKKSSQSAAVKMQNQKLATKYGIRGFPTILFIDAQGKVLGKSGYLKGGPAAWTKNADTLLK